MKTVNFKWYVLNDNFNTKEIKPYNIFNNCKVLEETNKLCRKYKKKDKNGLTMTFNEFAEELRKIIMWQEWSRCEYEILVSGLFWGDKEPKKIDCYEQALPNIRLIAKYVLEEYYPNMKITLGDEVADA